MLIVHSFQQFQGVIFESIPSLVFTIMLSGILSGWSLSSAFSRRIDAANSGTGLGRAQNIPVPASTLFLHQPCLEHCEIA